MLGLKQRKARNTKLMSTSQVQMVVAGLEKAKWALACALLLLGFVAFYFLGKHGQVIQWGALLLGLGLALGIFFTSVAGRDLVGFARDAWREVGKVVWPARKEAVQVTFYVFGFVLIMASFLWLTDKTLEWLLYDFVLGWKK